MTRQDYEKRFRLYPDVVTIAEFCAMLRIGDTYARKLLRQNLVGTTSSATPTTSPRQKSSTSC